LDFILGFNIDEAYDSLVSLFTFVSASAFTAREGKWWKIKEVMKTQCGWLPAKGLG